MDVFRAALDSLLNETVTTVQSERYTRMREAAAALQITDRAENIVSAIRGCFPSILPTKTIGSWREKAQSEFHQLRISLLPSLWRQFLEEQNPDVCEVTDQLLSQSLCQKIFDHEMMNRLRQVQERAAKKDSERPSIRLTSEEENALRYTAGSVPFCLLKKYETRVSEDAVYKFVRCLQSMGVQDEEADGDHSYTFSDYTSVWLQRNDRGHLFKISDETYRLFCSFELIIRRVLPQQLKSSTSTKEKIISSISDDPEVQEQWSSLAEEIGSQEQMSLLLQDVVTLWVTMRGFSMCSSWLEEYKAAKDRKTAKSTRLRKSLKLGKAV